MESIALSLAGFAAFYFLYSMVIPGYYALPLELNPKGVGRITGLLNTSANSAGFFGPITAGYLVADGGN
ncbi:MAG: MFS transporter, partial [Akkermansiaceae bacterium]|nr:MFS transporter [Akkermansiaceae bacterium]